MIIDAFVIAGLVPACPGHPHLYLLSRKKDVDARGKRGHDDG
jgi:hypothetical protein